jgi:hypothetical protein
VVAGPDRAAGILTHRDGMAEEAVSTNPLTGPGVSGQVGWAELLEEHGVQYVALDAGADRELIDHLRSSGGWEVRWRLSGTVLLARATLGSQTATSPRACDSR